MLYVPEPHHQRQISLLLSASEKRCESIRNAGLIDAKWMNEIKEIKIISRMNRWSVTRSGAIEEAPRYNLDVMGFNSWQMILRLFSFFFGLLVIPSAYVHLNFSIEQPLQLRSTGCQKKSTNLELWSHKKCSWDSNLESLSWLVNYFLKFL